MTEPITEADARTHLRVESDDPGADQIGTMITAARQAVERYLAVTIVNRARSYTIDRFPTIMRRIKLPNGPVTAITSVSYVDTDGATQTLTGSDVRLVNYEQADVIEPLFGETWPATREIPGAVTVNYTAGMMTGSPLTLPDKTIRQAILLHIGDLWAYREGALANVNVVTNPTVERLLTFYRRDQGI